MKASTLKLCLPVAIITAQHSAVGITIPPFLDHLAYPVSAIGALIAVGPMLSLLARLPSGFAYRGERAKFLMAAALTVVILCNLTYGFAEEPLPFALVHAFNGFAMGATTTIYLAFFVESLDPDEDRYHAMGYYSGAMAIGHSIGGLAVGMVADRFGYLSSFRFAALVASSALALFVILRPSTSGQKEEGSLRAVNRPTLKQSLQAIINPQMATIVVIAVFLNMTHQLHTAFIPLYSLAVGLTLTEAGLIKAIHALCNAITRPISGYVVKGLGHRSLSRVALPLQAATLMLIPFFDHLVPLLIVFVVVGFLRAIVLVANTIGMVQDVDKTRVSRGIASGVFHAAGDIGVVLGPSVGGLIASYTGIARLFFVAPLMIAVLFSIALWSCKFLGASRKRNLDAGGGPVD